MKEVKGNLHYFPIFSFPFLFLFSLSLLLLFLKGLRLTRKTKRKKRGGGWVNLQPNPPFLFLRNKLAKVTSIKYLVSLDISNMFIYTKFFPMKLSD